MREVMLQIRTSHAETDTLFKEMVKRGFINGIKQEGKPNIWEIILTDEMRIRICMQTMFPFSRTETKRRCKSCI